MTEQREIPDSAWFQMNRGWNTLEETIGPGEGSVAFIRADIAQAELAAAIALLNDAANAMEAARKYQVEYELDRIIVPVLAAIQTYKGSKP